MSKELAEPFGSPPGRPAKYVLYLSRHGDDDTQVMVVGFAARYAARKFLDELLQDDGIVWENDCTLRSETGIVVTTRWWPGRLRKCVEHEYSLRESGWDLPQPYLGWARTFRRGPNLPRTLEESPARERRASAPRSSAPAGYVHVSDIALGMGIEAKQARVALRKIYGDAKPAYGWYFDPKELDEVKRRIGEVLK